MRKAETIYTSRINNNNVYQARKASQMVRRTAHAFEKYAMAVSNSNVFYLNVNGITAPVCRF